MGTSYFAMWVIPSSKMTSLDLKTVPVLLSNNLYPSCPKYPSRAVFTDLGLSLEIFKSRGI